MCRVVIVDDDQGCLDMLEDLAWEVVGDDGSVEAYSDPNEFIEAASCGREPDLLIVDYVMPSMDGIRALRILRGKYGVNSAALIVTAYELEAMHRLLPTNNVSAIVAKPFNANEISRAIRDAVSEACLLSGKGAVA